MFGIRLPRALTAAFVNQALKASEGIAGLSVAMRGLIAARIAVMTAVVAIDADMRRMTATKGGEGVIRPWRFRLICFRGRTFRNPLRRAKPSLLRNKAGHRVVYALAKCGL